MMMYLVHSQLRDSDGVRATEMYTGHMCKYIITNYKLEPYIRGASLEALFRIQELHHSGSRLCLSSAPHWCSRLD